MTAPKLVMTAMESREVTWLRSSFCANGACVDVRRVGDTIQVRDGKLGDDGIVQEWTFAEWNWLLVAIIEGDDHPAVDLDDADVWLGAPALLFDRNEWNEFVKGVKVGEFDVDELSGSAPSEGYGAGLAQVGPGVGTRSDQVVTGAGAIAVPPVPVTTEPFVPLVGISAQRAQTLAGLGTDQIVDMVKLYGEACMAGADNLAADLLDAIRGALVPVTAVEFERQWGIRPDATLPLPPAETLEPRWGSGPLVKHVPETPADGAER